MSDTLTAFIKSQIRSEFDRKHSFVEMSRDYSLQLIVWMAEIDEEEAQQLIKDLPFKNN